MLIFNFKDRRNFIKLRLSEYYKFYIIICIGIDLMVLVLL